MESWHIYIAEEVTMASNGKAVTGTAVMARSANEEKKKNISEPWGFGSWQANMVEFEDTLRLERAELDSCEEARKANHQYRTSHGTYRIKRTQ